MEQSSTGHSVSIGVTLVEVSKPSAAVQAQV